MTNIFLLFAGLIAFGTVTNAAGPNLNKAGVILNGYDPVSYFQDPAPQKGDAKFQVKKGEITYWFSSQAHKDAFLKEPEKYQPQFGGWCAFAVADSKSKVDIDPTSFLIQDGKLLVFYNGLWGDTRKKWQQTSTKSPQVFLKEAETNWPEVMRKDP